jgi:hypothetical protein
VQYLLILRKVWFGIVNFIQDIIIFQGLLAMHQDYAAIALLLFTALPLISVALAAFFYVRNNERKTPLKREDFY